MTIYKPKLTEIDIIKHVTLKRQFDTIYKEIASKDSPGISDLNSKEHRSERKTLIKQAMKVWIAVGKFIKS